MTLGTQNGPQLAAVRAVLDPARITAALDTWFAAQGRPERAVEVSVQRLFYVPGAECSLVYSVTLEAGGRRETQILSAVLGLPDPAAMYAKAERKAAKDKFVTPGLGAAAYHCTDLDLVLWTFPNDPKLKTLPAQWRQAPRETLALLATAGAAAGLEMGPATRTLVRYIPRKRCVLRYEVEWHPPRDANGAPRTLPSAELQTVYSKTYDDVVPAREAHSILEALWRAAQTDSRFLRIPEPLPFDAEGWTTYQRGVPGAPLSQSAAQVTPAHAAAIGRGLAAMHLVRIPVRPRHDLDDEAVKMRAHAALVAHVHPDAAAELERIKRRLDAMLPGLPRLPLVTSHGTFKLAHLLHDGHKSALVDFDSFVHADPLYDVANFTADLHYLEAMGVLPPGRARRLATAFYESWSAHVPWGRRDAVLNWYVASLLVRKQALKCVKHLHADAAVKIGRVLEAARARIEGDGL